MSTFTYYTVGFLFSDDRRYVTLIHKKRPIWQAGLYNGVGGRREPGEQPVDTMVREFYEETGLSLPESEWRLFLGLWYPECVVNFFRAFKPRSVLQGVRSRTDELVVMYDIAHALSPHCPLIPNLRWIIPFALWEEPIMPMPLTITMKEAAYDTAGK